MSAEPRTGVLVRSDDETGISGTGVVAWIVEFPDGVAVTRWAVTDIRQTCVWASVGDVLAIHGHGGRTTIRWAERTTVAVTSGRFCDSSATRDHETFGCLERPGHALPHVGALVPPPCRGCGGLELHADGCVFIDSETDEEDRDQASGFEITWDEDGEITLRPFGVTP